MKAWKKQVNRRRRRIDGDVTWNQMKIEGGSIWQSPSDGKSWWEGDEKAFRK